MTTAAAAENDRGVDIDGDDDDQTIDASAFTEKARRQTNCGAGAAGGSGGGSGALNLSAMHSLESATATELVSVAKPLDYESPLAAKQLKKCFKHELKKEQNKAKQCSIQ